MMTHQRKQHTDPTIPSARAVAAAKERQLDWLLAEGLGEPQSTRAPSPRSPWPLAALVLLGLGTVLGVAMLRHEAPDHKASLQDPKRQDPKLQDPKTALVWHECHGPEQLPQVPADVTALRCFDFDDAACARLATFRKLEHLDLGAMSVDARGVSRSSSITDAGVRALAALTGLRSLSLAQCHGVQGFGLRALEALPALEHLDLTYVGVWSEAIERLPRLPSLRSLVLSHGMGFRGRSLAAVASMPGLRRLELRACTTLSAADVQLLAKLRELRHLDLRDCQGDFPGQVSTGPVRGGPDLFVDADDDGLPDRLLDRSEPIPDGAATFVDSDGDGLPDLRVDLTPPKEDGIGVTDAVVEALATLPLETLQLGGCNALTDAIGPWLARMTTLRELDLSGLPRTTGALLSRLPAELRSLRLDHNPQFAAASLHALARLTDLEDLGLSGLVQLHDADLAVALRGKRLQVLHLGDTVSHSKAAEPAALPTLPLSSAAAALLREQTQLHTLDLRGARWLSREVLAAAASLPQLQSLDLASAQLPDGALAELAANRSLRRLDLGWARPMGDGALGSLAPLRLLQLRLSKTQCTAERARELATQHWPGCEVTLPNGARFRAP